MEKKDQTIIMHPVKVVIPIYRPTLSPMERASILQTLKILGDHPIVILYPEGMQLPPMLSEYKVQCVAVSDEWLGTRNGIAGYNRMMMSEAFYRLFLDTEYILICHTDAWVFRDELLQWCRKKYDCVAAPWIRRPIYNLPVIKLYMAWLARYKKNRGKFCRQQLYGKIGNGGLSLRRVEAFYKACIIYQNQIQEYLKHRKHFFNEDVFWATVPENFHYPSEKEALRFSFDRHPEYCIKLNNNQLPFGCHSWSKPRMYRFWKNVILWGKY